MRLPIYLLAVSGGTLVQGTVVPALTVAGVVPDLPVLLVVWLALRQGPEAGCATGFALGLVQDAVAGGPFGLGALTRALIGFVAGEVPRLCLTWNPVVPVTVVLMASLADGVLRFVVLQLFHYPASFGELFVRVILPQAIYTALLAAIVVAVPAFRVRT